jgi:hypothetical protein
MGEWGYVIRTGALLVVQELLLVFVKCLVIVIMHGNISGMLFINSLKYYYYYYYYYSLFFSWKVIQYVNPII